MKSLLNIIERYTKRERERERERERKEHHVHKAFTKVLRSKFLGLDHFFLPLSAATATVHEPHEHERRAAEYEQGDVNGNKRKK